MQAAIDAFVRAAAALNSAVSSAAEKNAAKQYLEQLQDDVEAYAVCGSILAAPSSLSGGEVVDFFAAQVCPSCTPFPSVTTPCNLFFMLRYTVCALQMLYNVVRSERLFGRLSVAAWTSITQVAL